jgi:diguanylate cyclase (GGDEF)-like protein
VAIETCHVLEGDIDIAGVTASIGVATFPEHASEPESLFRAADAAMYLVKRDCKNAVGVAPAQ